MWFMRGAAGLSVLLLAACGGSEPRGQLSFTPRPELTAPPGDMAVRLLFTVNPLPGVQAAAAGSSGARGPKWGTIGLFESGPGLAITADIRNAVPGSYRLRILDEASCAALFMASSGGEPLEYVDTIDDAPVRLPQIAIDEQGEAKREYTAGGVLLKDFKERSVVMFDGSRPVACGSAIATRMPGGPSIGRPPPGGQAPGGGR